MTLNRPEMDALPPMLTLQEVADFLQVHKVTIYKEHQRGRITFVKVGSMTRVRRSELDRYLRANERERVA